GQAVERSGRRSVVGVGRLGRSVRRGLDDDGVAGPADDRLRADVVVVVTCGQHGRRSFGADGDGTLPAEPDRTPSDAVGPSRRPGLLVAVEAVGERDETRTPY